MDILIAALHAAAEYRFWISALLMAAVIAALVLLQPRRGWRVSMAVLVLLVLANQFFGDRLAGALQARHGNGGAATDVVVDDSEDRYNRRGDDNGSAGTTVSAGGATGSPRQVETAR